MSELKWNWAYLPYLGPPEKQKESAQTAGYIKVVSKDEADKVIAELKADYKEACDRLQTANLIKDEQKAKADKLLSCLKCLTMRALIKDCPEKASAIEIVKEYEKWMK